MPPDVVTVISTTPAPGGATAVIEVALTTVYDAAAMLPNFTAVAAERLTPVIVMLVPPAVCPPDGETAVTAGPVT